TYFYHSTSNRKPTNQQVRLLEQFFYWVGVNGRYSAGSEGKIAEDFTRMDEIAKGNAPSYINFDLTVEPAEIEETYFSAGNAFCKSILDRKSTRLNFTWPSRMPSSA